MLHCVLCSHMGSYHKSLGSGRDTSEDRRLTAAVAAAYRSKKPLEIYKFFKTDIWVGIGWQANKLLSFYLSPRLSDLFKKGNLNSRQLRVKDVSARLTWVLPYLTLTSSLQGSLIPSFQLNHSHPWIHPSVRPSLVQPLLSFVVNEGPPAPLPSSPFSPSTGPSSYHFSPPTPTAHDATLQCFLFNCLQPSVPLFSIMPFQQLPPHFDQFSGLCSLHRDTPQSLRTDEGCLIWAVTLTLVHHPQTFLPAFLRSFSHFLLSFSKNPWIPPNSHFLSFFFFFSHFLLTGDLFLLFSEGKKKSLLSLRDPH